MNLVERIKAGDAEAIEAAKAMPRRARPQPESKFASPQTELEAKSEDLRLMLWAVRKIGDLTRAEEAFKSVVLALSPAPVVSRNKEPAPPESEDSA